LELDGGPDSSLDALKSRVSEQTQALSEDRVGLMLPAELAATDFPSGNGIAAVFPWGSWSNPEELAHRLFAGLRHLDSLGCTVILCPMPPEQGIGVAIRDRLRKAAS
jgi:L-threonylcarbamoyladenylate synthase